MTGKRKLQHQIRSFRDLVAVLLWLIRKPDSVKVLTLSSNYGFQTELSKIVRMNVAHMFR